MPSAAPSLRFPNLITRPLQKSSEDYADIIPGRESVIPGVSKPSRLASPSKASLANYDADTQAIEYGKAAVEKYGGQAAHYVSSAVDSVERKLLEGHAINPADIVLFNGFLKGFAGFDIETSQETIDALAIGGPPSKEIAFKVGAGAGALASMYGMGVVLGATGVEASILADLYKYPKIARFVEPAMSWGATTAMVDTVHEGVRQVQAGKLDFERFGKVLLHGGLTGSVGGLTQGFSGGLARTVGGTAFGYASTLMAGGSQAEAAVNAGVMGLFSVISTPQRTKAQQEGVYGYTLKNIEKAFETTGLEKGYTPEQASWLGRAGKNEFAATIEKAGGVEKIKVADMEKTTKAVWERVSQVLDQKPPEVVAKPLEISQEAPAQVVPPLEPATIAPAPGKIAPVEAGVPAAPAVPKEPVKTPLAVKEPVKPEPKPLQKISHFTRPENIPAILEQGFDTSKPPIHGVGGKEGGLKTGKAAGDILYFTTDNARWGTAKVFVGEGKGDISTVAYDYDKQQWKKEMNAYSNVNLAPIEAEIKANAKILVVDSLAEARKMLGDKFDRDEMVQRLVDIGKEKGYDIVNLKNPGGKAWEDVKPNKMGDLNRYEELSGHSGKDDYFVLNREVLNLPKSKPTESLDDIIKPDKPAEMAASEVKIEPKPVDAVDDKTTEAITRHAERMAKATGQSTEAFVKNGQMVADYIARKEVVGLRNWLNGINPSMNKLFTEITGKPAKRQYEVNAALREMNPEAWDASKYASQKIQSPKIEETPSVGEPILKTEAPISKADGKNFHNIPIEEGSLKDIKEQVIDGLKKISAFEPTPTAPRNDINSVLRKAFNDEKSLARHERFFIDGLKKVMVADKPIKIHIPDDGTFIIEPTKYGVEQAIRIFSKASPGVFSPVSGKVGEAKVTPGGKTVMPPGSERPPSGPESSLGRWKLIGEVQPAEKVAVAASKSVPGAQASAGGQTIDAFEKVETAPPQDMKLSQEVKAIFDKYDTRVGEKYVSGEAGLFYRATENVRLRALNDISTAAHELSHRFDHQNAIMAKVYAVPKVDPAWKKVRKELTTVYTKYYPGGKKDHKLSKRMVEGYATFIQKFIEQPTKMREEFPLLAQEILQTGGRLQNDMVNEAIKDFNAVIAKYQALDPLSKVGARVTEVFKQNELKGGFLTLWDKTVTQIVDEVHPLSKLARVAGAERTASDPSLWVRQYNNSSAIVLNNMRGNDGLWMPKANGDFVKVSDKNLGDLVKMVKEKGATDDFNDWLVARDQHFGYQELDSLKEQALAAQMELKDLKEAMMAGEEMTGGDIRDAIAAAQAKIEQYHRLDGILKNNAFDREVVKQAYEEHAHRFLEEEKLFDAFTKSNLDLLNEAGLITGKQYREFTAKKGYAPLKRDVFDEILGTGDESLPPTRTGPSRVSSMLGRRGSQLDIIAPLASLFKDHAEVVRKALKQIIVNKTWAISKQFPELFQEIALVRQYDPKTKVTKYPQDKDPNLLIARDAAGKRHPLLVAREIKTVMDNLLDFHNIHIFERLMRRSAGIFTKGTTGAYPLFAPANFVIDQITAAAQTRNAFIPLYDPLAQMGKALLDHGSPEAKFLQTYLAAGGERQTFARWQDLQPDELFNKIAGEKNALMKAVELIDTGYDWISWPSSKSEIMTRAAEYIKSRKAGNPHIVALEDAGRVSVPFHHIGAMGGGTVGKTLVKAIPFMNPGIQALAQYARSIKNKSTRNRSAFVTLAVIASSIASMAYLMAKATQNQKDLYTDLEPDELANYLWLPHPDGKRLLKFRVPEQMNMPATLINMELANLKMGANYTGRDFLAAGTTFLPDQINISDPVRQFMSLIPQLTKPGLMVLVGKKDWPRIREMESMGLKNKEPGQRFNESTSEFAKWAGGKMNLSPIKIDYLIEGYMGRITRFATGKEITNPFVRDYYFTAGRNLQDYYETRENVRARLTTQKDSPGAVPDAELKTLLVQQSIIKQTEKLLKWYREFEKEAKADKASRPKMEKQAEKLRRAILDNVDELRTVKKRKP